MRAIDSIIIHCSYTPADMDVSVSQIRDWHLSRGWSDIGYHFIILRNGFLESGRPIVLAGAHAKGHNKTSIGICLVGGMGDDGTPDCNYTADQWKMLATTTKHLVEFYNTRDPIGHRDLPGVTKECPCFDVTAWWSSIKG